MNDRYLYRAKSTDNGEWVEGFLFQLCCDGRFYWCIGNEPLSPNDYSELYGLNREWFYIDESTICQCTGLCDEDGKKIYEGDIVGFTDFASTESGYSELCCRGHVTWDQETASLQVTDRISAESYEVFDRGCKVIGNIFDTPEMLEEWQSRRDDDELSGSNILHESYGRRSSL